MGQMVFWWWNMFVFNLLFYCLKSHLARHSSTVHILTSVWHKLWDLNCFFSEIPGTYYEEVGQAVPYKVDAILPLSGINSNMTLLYFHQNCVQYADYVV